MFELAALADLRWSVATRFMTTMAPAAVLGALQQAAEVGYIVTDTSGNRVGMVGYVDPDPASQAVWLDGIARPGDTEGWVWSGLLCP